MRRPKLSVCITTFNMGHFLPLLLRNVEDVADEIVVLDSLSDDNTVELVKAHPKGRLLERAFDHHYGRHKNAVLEAAQGDWVLLLDSDELISDRLREMLPKLIRSRWYTHYKLPRYWLAGANPWTYVDSSAHYPDHLIRLFRNTPFWRYGDDQPAHEHFPRKGRGPKKRLREGHLFHFNFLLHDRASREGKVATYTELRPDRADTSQDVYLFEEGGAQVKPCKEGLDGVKLDELHDHLVA